MRDRDPQTPRRPGRPAATSAQSGHRHRPEPSPNLLRPKWLQKSPRDLELIFFDLETTGGNPSNSRIIEIAAIKHVNGQEIARFETLVNPGRRIPHIVQEITGISNDMVRSAPPLEDVIHEFIEFIGDAVLVAHGAQSDYAFVKQACHELVKKPFTNYYLCTHLLVSNLLPDLPSKTLSGVAEHFGSRIENTHRAMVDAELTRDVLLGLLRQGRSLGILTLEDFFKVQGDNETLRRLGPGISPAEIKMVPSSPGVFYFFNSQGEINFLSATPNLKRSFSNLSGLTDEKDFNRLLVDLSDYKFQRHNHFLGALLAEGRELTKFDLALDPRKLESRSKGFVQVLIPPDLLAFITSHASDIGFDVFGSRGRVSETVREFEALYTERHLLNPGPADSEASDAPVDRSRPHTSPELDAFLNDGQANQRGRGPIRRTRIAYPSRAQGKFALRRESSTTQPLQFGHLHKGVGWVFGPFEQPKAVQKEFERLIEILPIHDAKSGFNQRLLYVRLLVSHLYGRIAEERAALVSQKRTMRYILHPGYRATLKETLRRIEALESLQIPVSPDVLPQSGLAIVSNTDSKELDVAVVVKSRIREVVRLPIEESDKLQSKRFFTRLFCKYNDELTNDSFPILFSDEVCTDLELFHHWKKFRSLEGDWVSFDDLSPLYDLSLL
jgi:DNA polymerase III epsilon subunit family exonuclease